MPTTLSRLYQSRCFYLFMRRVLPEEVNVAIDFPG